MGKSGNAEGLESFIFPKTPPTKISLIQERKSAALCNLLQKEPVSRNIKY